MKKRIIPTLCAVCGKSAAKPGDYPIVVLTKGGFKYHIVKGLKTFCGKWYV